MTLPAAAQALWPRHLVLPGAVRAVEFVSDVHLCAEMPRTAAAFLHYLAHTRADVVCLLGDVFEAWVGDDAAAALPFERDCVAALAALAQRSRVLLMSGNRDFLFGPALLATSGATGLADPCVLEAFDQRVLVTHGDALCIADAPYQQMRRVVRSPAWQADFLARPLAERLATARALRAQSQAQHATQAPETYADADAALATQWLADAHASVLIHGHTHRPGSDALPNGATRHVLSDWEQDAAAPPRAEVLRWTAQGFSRHPLAEFGEPASA